jgi:hypothetical protein
MPRGTGLGGWKQSRFRLSSLQWLLMLHANDDGRVTRPSHIPIRDFFRMHAMATSAWTIHCGWRWRARRIAP